MNSDSEIEHSEEEMSEEESAEDEEHVETGLKSEDRVSSEINCKRNFLICPPYFRIKFDRN